MAKRTSKLVDWASPWQAMRWSMRTVAPGGTIRRRVAQLQDIRDEGEVTRKLMEARCDRGAEIARMLYLSEETAAAIRSLDEHWDGRGQPDGLAGEEIPLLARILCLAQTVEIFHAAGGVKAARQVARRRRGRWFDPALVDAFLAICRDRAFWASLEEPDVSHWEPSDLRPARRRRAHRPDRRGVRAGDRREVALHRPALGARGRDRRRDRRRARLRPGRPARPAACRAAARHRQARDLQPDPRQARQLTDDEFATIKEHPAHSLRILQRAPCFASIADLAADHHERIDGTGYPRGRGGDELGMPVRALAVADVYEALTADRPYRGPMPVEKALDIVSWEVPGRLDRAAFSALESWLGAARSPRRARTSACSPSART